MTTTDRKILAYFKNKEGGFHDHQVIAFDDDGVAMILDVKGLRRVDTYSNFWRVELDDNTPTSAIPAPAGWWLLRGGCIDDTDDGLWLNLFPIAAWMQEANGLVPIVVGDCGVGDGGAHVIPFNWDGAEYPDETVIRVYAPGETLPTAEEQAALVRAKAATKKP